MFDRAERRHHIERLKEARKSYGWRKEPLTPRQLGAMVQHPQMCSCSGCGNPRRHKWFKSECLTLQERSQIEALKKIETSE
jgi:hypothetical protein